MRAPLFIVAVFSLMIVGVRADASEIRLDASRLEIRTGEQVAIDVIVHANTTLNAMSGSITFPNTLLTVAEIRDGASVIDFWIEEPESREAGLISFSGITASGFSGANNHLFTIIFDAVETGEAPITFVEYSALRHDGDGSAETLSAQHVVVTIQQGDSQRYREDIRDREPPEDFTPIIATDPLIFDGDAFLVFSTRDKGSGMSRYEVREGTFSFYREAPSPYRLANQDRTVDVYVRATDHAGNMRIAIAPALHPPAVPHTLSLLGILVVLLGFISSILYWYRRKRVRTDSTIP